MLTDFQKLMDLAKDSEIVRPKAKMEKYNFTKPIKSKDEKRKKNKQIKKHKQKIRRKK